MNVSKRYFWLNNEGKEVLNPKCCGYWCVRRFKEDCFLTYPYVLDSCWWCPVCGKMWGGYVVEGTGEEDLALKEWRLINDIQPLKRLLPDG
jgi:hypothetical protein